MNILLNQYKTIKAKYADAIFLFRVGDFYETFGDDAEIVSKQLQIPLTKSPEDDSKTMAGFPFHSLDSYLRTLVKAGYKVAVCEQLEDPKKTKGTANRGVTDHFSP